MRREDGSHNRRSVEVVEDGFFSFLLFGFKIGDIEVLHKVHLLMEDTGNLHDSILYVEENDVLSDGRRL